jgi:hypothetical protein
VNQAVKDISASYDALVDLFESIESFLNRFDIYTKIPLTAAMTDIVTKIIVKVLNTLALAMKQVKQGRPIESLATHALLRYAAQGNLLRNSLERMRSGLSYNLWIDSLWMRLEPLEHRHLNLSTVLSNTERLL